MLRPTKEEHMYAMLLSSLRRRTAATAQDLHASRYLSVISFKQTTQELIGDKFSHINPSVVACYATMMATFPTAVSDL
ncbi:hypothetical protein N7465_002116 [Penicillium sp. CMV-2018d]|nr:hypothetical protein N7465_002116 [Penicillium sp. CMV-2018d]